MAHSHRPYLFGLQTPIIQAPMAGVSTPELAAAVSNAGGLGSIAIGASSLAESRRMIEKTRALTNKPFNVNVFCHQAAQRDAKREAAWIQHLQPLFREFGQEPPQVLNEIYKSFIEDPEVFSMLLEQRPAFVSFHFGLPAVDQIKAFRDAGIITLATATSAEEASRIETSGIHAIVAQGIEAGGHRGVFDPDTRDEQLSTAVLVRILMQQTRLPVIAAGGIMDGRGIRAALDLGAAGVQLGTAFILCAESAASETYRSQLMSARAASTQMTTVISGRPARGMINRLVTHGEAEGAPSPASYPLTYDIAKQLHSLASQQGCHDFATLWAGQGAPLARSMNAKELMAILLREMEPSPAGA